MNHLRHRILIAAFLASLLVPGLLAVLAPLSALLPKTPQVPLLRSSSMRSFPQRFEQFFESHLGGRHALVAVDHAIYYWGFAMSPTDAVIVGEQGWAFLNQDYMPQSLAGEPFAQGQLEQWLAVFKDAQRFVATWKGQLLVVVAPNKASIYPEYLPASIKSARGVPRLDKFNRKLVAEGIEVLDLRPAMAAAKSRAPTHCKFDTHWNGWGALVATREIAKSISAMTSKPVRFDLGAFEFVSKPYVGDLASMMVIEPFVNNTTHLPVARIPMAKRLDLPTQQIAAGGPVWNEGALAFSSQNKDGPTVLVHHDSFGLPLVNVLPHVLGDSVWLYFTRSFNHAALSRTKPDVVVYLIAERYLHQDPPTLPSEDLHLNE